MRSTFYIVVILLSLSAFAQDADLTSHWKYDQNAPLDVQQEGIQFRDGVTVQDITYASPKGGRVPAYLIVPEGKGKFPAVLWGHWYWPSSEFANRREFLEEAIALAGSGVASLLISGPIARPDYVRPKSPFTDEAAAYLVQEVVDMRRGVDLLLARKDIDGKRIAYVGHSYNATVGGILSGVDRRFVAYVLMAGNLSYEADSKTKTFQEIRTKMGADNFDALLAKYAWADPGKYVSHAAPATVFLQYATKEDFLNADQAKQYLAVVSDPKKFKIYDAPHALNQEARRERLAFLADQLKVRMPSADIVARIPVLPQPDK